MPSVDRGRRPNPVTPRGSARNGPIITRHSASVATFHIWRTSSADSLRATAWRCRATSPKRVSSTCASSASLCARTRPAAPGGPVPILNGAFLTVVRLKRMPLSATVHQESLMLFEVVPSPESHLPISVRPIPDPEVGSAIRVPQSGSPVTRVLMPFRPIVVDGDPPDFQPPMPATSTGVELREVLPFPRRGSPQQATLPDANIAQRVPVPPTLETPLGAPIPPTPFTATGVALFWCCRPRVRRISRIPNSRPCRTSKRHTGCCRH